MLSENVNWKPSATNEVLIKRARLINQIRSFFADKNVLEVDTPALSSGTITDPHLRCFETTFRNPMSPRDRTLFLQTSPEFAMKRLLCAGSGAIFQICKAFRNEEAGRHHNPEFTMLEWYRPGFDHVALMAEVDELIQQVLGAEPADKISYQDVFVQFLGIDPLAVSLSELVTLACERGFSEIAMHEQHPDTLLQLLFSEIIEPKIGLHRPCFVTGFPASQAALARLEPSDNRIARRFELYFRGIELANGFHELSDPVEQRQRFEHDNNVRAQLGLPAMPIDQNLLSALQNGLPDCAGVALGIDRLLMLAMKKSTISEILTFSVSNA